MDRETIIARLVAIPAAIERAESRYVEAVTGLETTEASLLLSGEIAGKNEQERRAQLRLRLERPQAQADEARIRLHTLQNEFAALRAVTRLLAGSEE